MSVDRCSGREEAPEVSTDHYRPLLQLVDSLTHGASASPALADVLVYRRALSHPLSTLVRHHPSVIYPPTSEACSRRQAL